MKSFLFFLLFPALLFGERIITLSPSLAEIVFALGKGDEVVATSSYSLYPIAAQKLPTIGSYPHPSLEAIISYAPTLVLGQVFHHDTLEKLKKLHIKTLEVELTTLQNIQKSIQKIAKALNADASKLILPIQSALKESKMCAKGKRVLVVYGLRMDLTKGLYIAGQHIFFNDILESLGAKNAFTNPNIAQPVVGLEQILSLNPDTIILLHSHATQPDMNTTKVLQTWYNLPIAAAKKRQVFIIDKDFIHIPSHRVARTIKEFAKVLCHDSN